MSHGRGETGSAARRALRRAVGRALAACLALLGAGRAEASVSIQSFSLQPVSPTTGDALILTAVIESTSSCDFVDATIRLGPQDELAGQQGWGIDVDFQDGPLPVVSTCPIEKNFGSLQVFSGSGVLRARDNGVVDDSRLFTLSVAPGPAPGWSEPSLHGGFDRQSQCSAITAIPGGLAMNDLLRHQILFVDPQTGDELSNINAPGSGDVRGLAYDGTSLFASVRDAFGPRIYRLDLLGRILDAFPSPVISPGNAPLEGLAFLNGVLYGSYESPPTLFAINPSTHQKLWERSLPGRILALDAAPEGLLGAQATGDFYFIEPSAAGQDILMSDPVETGITGLPNLTGLAYDGSITYVWDANAGRMLFMRTFALWWAVDGTLQTYVPSPDRAVDVIRGDLVNVFQVSGYLDLSFFGPAVCLASRGVGGVVPEADDPPAGHAFYYLARFIDATGGQSSYGRTSDGFRRIDTSNACP